jgi:hypothetical protein
MPHLFQNDLKVSVLSGRAKMAKGRCCLQNCTTKAGNRKVYCERHAHAIRKVFDPVGYIYSHRKQRAKQRGHEWSITLDNWRDWCAFNRYHELTGRTAASMSIERKDSAHGYHIWNIATLTLGQNAAKGTQQTGGYYTTDDLGVTHYHKPYQYEEPPF